MYIIFCIKLAFQAYINVETLYKLKHYFMNHALWEYTIYTKLRLRHFEGMHTYFVTNLIALYLNVYYPYMNAYIHVCVCLYSRACVCMDCVNVCVYVYYVRLYCLWVCMPACTRAQERARAQLYFYKTSNFTVSILMNNYYW